MASNQTENLASTKENPLFIHKGAFHEEVNGKRAMKIKRIES